MKNKTREIDFMAIKKYPFIISFILISLVAISTFTMGVNLDIQFKGGSILTYSYTGEIDSEDLQKSLAKEAGFSARVNKTTDIKTREKNLVIEMPDSLSSDEMKKLEDVLSKSFSSNKLENVSVSNIDPTMGQEFFTKCLTATALTLVLMILFIAIRFRRIGGFLGGLTAVLALIHDVIMIFGTFVLLGFPINDNFIAAVLTIVGYSINDTIVIYDRIRENSQLMPEGRTVYELVNLSINQSLKRTVNTTVTTVLSVSVMYAVALYYNITSIQMFALPMIVGMLSGIYSTIFIATPLWAVLQSRKQKKAASPA